MSKTVSSPSSSVAHDFLLLTRKSGVQIVSIDAWRTQKFTNSVTYGDNYPDWRLRIVKGLNATTTLVGSKVKIRLKNGALSSTRPKEPLANNNIYLAQYDGAIGLSLAPYVGDPSGIDETKANNAALMKFVSKLEEVNTAFSGGVFLGELAQTLHSIRNPAQSLRRLVADWRSTGVKLRRTANLRPLNERKRLVKEALADSWLEAQFHWKPLLNDIDDGCRALAEINTNQSLVGPRISGKGEDQSLINETTATTGQNILFWQESERTISDTVVIYRGAVRVNPRNSLLMAPRLLGFNPASFVPTAWELVPYSFLIDYFTNVGDVLSGWSHCVSELSWCSKTTRKTFRTVRMARTWTALCQAFFPDVTSATGVASVVIDKTSVNRGAYSGTLTPGFTFEIPGSGSKKWLNIAALIASRDSDRRFSLGD